MFKKNIGKTDQVIRIAIGIVLLSLLVVGPKTAWGWLGIIPLATGVFGTCGLYSLLGISTSGNTGS